LDNAKPNPPVVDYATPDPARMRSSRYSIAAVFVSTASIVWWFNVVPIFTPAKQDRVGALGGLLGVILAIAGWRLPHCKRALAKLGFWLGLVGFLANWALPSL
jgi:hypothetical protein